MAETVFSPIWLYGPEGATVLCEDAEHCTVMRAQGWGDSPSLFGVETHPARPVQQIQRPGLADAPPPATLPADLLARLNSWMGSKDQEIAALRMELSMLQRQLSDHDHGRAIPPMPETPLSMPGTDASAVPRRRP